MNHRYSPELHPPRPRNRGRGRVRGRSRRHFEIGPSPRLSPAYRGEGWVACALMVFLFASGALAAGTSAGKYLDKPADWYRSDEATKIAASVLSYEAPEGGWPKNVDTATTQPYTGDPSKLHSTYDNGATTDEIR